MSKRNHISTVAVLLLSLIFVSCTANNENASTAPEPSILHSDLSSESSSASSSSQTPASSQYVDPDRPPSEKFLPEAPATSWAEPQSELLALEPAKNKASIATFDGNAYTVINYRLSSHVASALYGPADLFFVVDNKMYYSDKTGVYLMKENVYEIAGSDAEGIFLIVPDDDVLPIDSFYETPRTQASLVHYNPVSGTVQTFINNVQAATVDQSHRILFYATPQVENNQHGYRYLIKRRELSQGEGSTVFTDEYIPSEISPRPRDAANIPDDSYNAAFKIEFYLKDDVVGAQVEYPFPSEFPYERHIWFDTSGNIIADSEIEEVLFQGEYMTTGIFQYSYDYYIPEKPVELGPYRVRVVAHGSGFTTFDSLIVHNGEELYWGWHSGAQMKQAGELLFSSSAIYNGSFSYALPFGGGQMLKINDNLYYFAQNNDGVNDEMTLYRAIGTKENPIAFTLLGRLRAERSDDFHLGLYGSSVYTAGDYVIILGTLDTIMVVNTRTDCTVAAGMQQVQCYVS